MNLLSRIKSYGGLDLVLVLDFDTFALVHLEMDG